MDHHARHSGFLRGSDVIEAWNPLLARQFGLQFCEDLGLRNVNTVICNLS